MLTSTDTYSDLYTTLLKVTLNPIQTPWLFKKPSEFQAMSYRSSSESVTSSIHALLEAMMMMGTTRWLEKKSPGGFETIRIHRDGVA